MLRGEVCADLRLGIKQRFCVGVLLPGDINLTVLCHAVAQVEIDQALIGYAGFFR